MAPNIQNPPPPNPNDKVLHVWSKPVEPGQEGSAGQAESSGMPSGRPTVSDAMSMIKTDDFTNVHNTPCARQGFMTGIGSGAAFGGLKFVLHGNATKAANWAVGFFVAGSIVSYEYCQYLRRAERIQMKRNIEVVSANRREQAKQQAEKATEEKKKQEELAARSRSWYKFW